MRWQQVSVVSNGGLVPRVDFGFKPYAENARRIVLQALQRSDDISHVLQVPVSALVHKSVNYS